MVAHAQDCPLLDQSPARYWTKVQLIGSHPRCEKRYRQLRDDLDASVSGACETRDDVRSRRVQDGRHKWLVAVNARWEETSHEIQAGQCGRAA